MRFTVLAAALFLSIWAQALSAPPPLKSFKDWKHEKIRQATLQAEHTRVQMRLLKTRPQNNISMIRHLDQQLTQEQWSLEVAQDLSVTDYLVLYLAGQSGSGRLTEAASKLSAKETAQVLEAYIRAAGGIPSDSRLALPSQSLQNR